MKILLIALLLLPAISQAAESCPWLNAATAQGILGYPVHVKVQDTNCDFGPMQITIQNIGTSKAEFAADVAQCESKPIPLKAIGNEAVLCTLAANTKNINVQVVGRVRDKVFIIRIGTMNPQLTTNLLSQQAREVAEHVAGNLF